MVSDTEVNQNNSFINNYKVDFSPSKNTVRIDDSYNQLQKFLAFSVCFSGKADRARY